MRLSLALAAALGLGACSTPPTPTAPTPTAVPTAEPAPAGVIPRPALDELLAKGPGELMDIVPVEDVLEGQTFVGWRVQGLPRDWQGAGIEAGDVITSVNGMPVSRPEELWSVWTMLGVASEIKLAYLRGKERGEVSLPIWGSPDPGAAAKVSVVGPPSSAGSAGPSASAPSVELPPPPPSATGKVRKPTIVIKGEDKPLSETDSSWRD
ncbi:MAG: hypothetical protein HY908_21460 [Myxococcales bacterium]|nr:hypothetical protein [Myxococcales bacterium]